MNQPFLFCWTELPTHVSGLNRTCHSHHEVHLSVCKRAFTALLCFILKCSFSVMTLFVWLSTLQQLKPLLTPMSSGCHTHRNLISLLCSDVSWSGVLCNLSLPLIHLSTLKFYGLVSASLLNISDATNPPVIIVSLFCCCVIRVTALN